MVISSVNQITAALRSCKEGLAWVTEVTFGSRIWIALLVFPLAVPIGWILGITGMNLIYDGFQVTMLALTISLVNYVI
jgi:Ca2+:H+ antiporter